MIYQKDYAENPFPVFPLFREGYDSDRFKIIRTFAGDVPVYFTALVPMV